MLFRFFVSRPLAVRSPKRASGACVVFCARCNFTSPSSPSSSPPLSPHSPEEHSMALIIARYVAPAGNAKEKDIDNSPTALLSQIRDKAMSTIELTSDAKGNSFVKLRGISALELLQGDRSAGPNVGTAPPQGAVDFSPFEAKLLSMAEKLLTNAGVNATTYMTVDHLYEQVMKACALHAPGDPLKDIVAKRLELPAFLAVLGIAGHAVLLVNDDTTATDRVQKHLLRERFWVFRCRTTLYIAPRRTDAAAGPPYFRLVSRTMTPTESTSRRDFGGWGSALSVPTKEDVYEILKYVPVHWGNFSNLNIPPAVRKRHIRSSSPLMWFRRQPCYFELREINYTTEIRRSPVLHPEAHQMTPEEANELLDLKMTFWEANSLVQLDRDGKPLEEQSAFEKSVAKFVTRVCPTYFSPLGIILQRYTKRSMTAERLLSVARAAPGEFEIVCPRYVDEPLVRRRGGADSERWRVDFVKDLESCPADVVSIIDVFNVLTPMWDRPEYVYVRLLQKTQERLGGYEGLLQLLRRHPKLFKVGSHFVCRVDASNPLSASSREPLPDDMTSRTGVCEENPYLSPLELAKVFHYVAPQHEGCTVSFLVDAASPAMRAALPPQVITVLQQFPRLFACKENSPGEFMVYKIVASSRSGGSDAPTATSSANGQGQEKENRCEDAEEDDSWILEEEQAVGKELGKRDTLEEVHALVPESGVAVSQLLLWTSLPVQQAANSHYGGLLKMIECHENMFRVVDTADGKRIYRAPPQTREKDGNEKVDEKGRQSE